MKQPTLPLRSPPRSYRPILVDDACAATVLNVHRSTIAEWSESGELLWVFDLASPGATRAERRYWLGEIMARQAKLPFQHDLATALDAIVGHPHDTELRTETVSDILQSQRQTVHTWLERGELRGPSRGSRQFVTRASLIEFLKKRRLA